MTKAKSKNRKRTGQAGQVKSHAGANIRGVRPVVDKKAVEIVAAASDSVASTEKAHDPAVEALTQGERKELAELEAIVNENAQSCLAAGAALLKIRDDELFRAEYRTFDEYCHDRWGWGASRARQLIAAAETRDNLKSVTNVTPTNESQVRPLMRLEPEEQRAVWAEAVNSAPKPPTGRDVARAAERRFPRGDAKPNHDPGAATTKRAAGDTEILMAMTKHCDEVLALDHRLVGDTVDESVAKAFIDQARAVGALADSYQASLASGDAEDGNDSEQTEADADAA